ncbi:hypothetical protein Cantr_07336 [Candida viswanathii]|uniref:ABC-2 type transporter transmembrane domain-containing protein n=1 Tax=Candida viswanathii TaxID=5486 RepID=A0A367Y030_9ASCO|nr:hypothetical protein Cantr_07336 [Candida viswanathii]
MVNGGPLDNSFQRSIGYVQQQDLHLETSTVREALRFSARLRQARSVPVKEKDRYVEKIIDLMEMRPYADALLVFQVKVWRNSREYKAVQRELDRLESLHGVASIDKEEDSEKTYASSLWKQYVYVLQRVFQQYWRTPSYIYSKFAMAILCSLFNGFTFFNRATPCKVRAIVCFPKDLYEARERPSKTFSWFAFIAAQVTAEIPYQIVAAAISFFCWYYPVGMYKNAVYSGDVANVEH